VKIDLKVYVAQPRAGVYTASVPWLAELANPITGPSPAQLKEELALRVMELASTGIDPASFERLIPPDNAQLGSVYVDASRSSGSGDGEIQLDAVTHVMLGEWDDGLLRAWPVVTPGVCLVMRDVEELYGAISRWASEWAEENGLEDLSPIDCPYWGRVDEIEVELGWPAPPGAEPPGPPRPRATELGQVARNLSHLAEDGQLLPAFGRDDLVGALVEVLTSPRPERVCLVGPPGAGKTALIHEAVRRANQGRRSYQSGRDAWETGGDRIIAGMSLLGQWERRVEGMCEELHARGDVLVVDDLLALVRAGRTYGSDSSVARFIEPELERDRFAVVAEATERQWELARSEAPGFVDMFRPIRVAPMTRREALGVLTQLVRALEAEQDALRFRPDALEAILALTTRFMRHEAQPGKTVRLARQCEADAARRWHEGGGQGEVVVDAAAVTRVFERQVGLPPAMATPGVGRPAGQVRAALGARVFGQPDALDAATGVIVTVEQGMSAPDRPLSTMLFVGPSGVGKTEAAKAIAAELYGSADRMLRLDMSEYATGAAVTRLVGSARRPEGELTSRVRLQPFSVILFDEIEKAHPSVLDLLLQVLGDGRLTDASGRVADFAHAVVVMTSNLGAGDEDHGLGFGEETTVSRSLRYRRAAEEFFRPELFNRIDHVVPFGALGEDALRQIARRTLGELLGRRGARREDVIVEVDEKLVDLLVQGAEDARYGARALGRRIEQRVISPLAARLAPSRPGGGLTRVSVRAGDGEAIEVASAPVEVAPTRALELGRPTDWRQRAFARLLEPPPELDPSELVDALAELAESLEAIEQDPRLLRVRRDYEALLARVQRGVASDDEAERLRLRELLFDRVSSADQRLDAVRDPGSAREILRPGRGVDRARLRSWQALHHELAVELALILLELEDVATPGTPGRTVVVSQAAGQTHTLMPTWAATLAALDADAALDALFMQRVSGQWVPLDASEAIAPDAVALAVSSLTPGADALLGALDGYAWSPRDGSGAAQGLLAITSEPVGHASHDAMRQGLESLPPSGRAPRVEFVHRPGALEELRSGRRWATPRAATAPGRAALELALTRYARSVFQSTEEE
jgi:ATP-dependent Clp protease ATP-binding subunit ClpC